MMSGPRTLAAVRRATPADASRLAALAATTFAETFAADNDPEDMAAYAAESFSTDLQRRELLDARNIVLFAERDGDTVGYAMLHDGERPSCVASPSAIEISRFYAAGHAIGSGVGSALMRACLAEAAALRRDTVWLGVWERNARAIAFYRRWGFVDVGSHHFQLGRDRQTDRILRRGVMAAG